MKVLVVHPAQQHSYRLATALKRKGMLEKYITTVYYKDHSYTKLITNFLPANFKKKAQNRVCSELSGADVVQFCEKEGLIKLFTMNIPLFRKYYKKVKYHTADRFAKKVAEYAIQQNVDAIVSYDDSSSVLFKLLKEQAPNILRIMDVSAANVLYMKEIYEKDTKLQPSFSQRLFKEREIVWNTDTQNRTKIEIENADYFLVPSQFVKQSYMFSNVKEEQIFICPYGVDTQKFSKKQYRNIVEPIRFIYVGGVKELKGISYLLEAISQIPKEQAMLTIVGAYNPEEEDIQSYKERVHFTGSVLHSEVSNLLQESDVYVFPSLGEGLSLSTLEAASCGLPLIVSTNSGVNDYIQEGKEGFVIPIQDTKALVEKMNWFIEHPEQIEEMGKSARNLALSYTWENYYERMATIFEALEKRS